MAELRNIVHKKEVEVSPGVNFGIDLASFFLFFVGSECNTGVLGRIGPGGKLGAGDALSVWVSVPVRLAGSLCCVVRAAFVGGGASGGGVSAADSAAAAADVGRQTIVGDGD